MSQKTALIILDGWGEGDHSKSDVISNAQTPFIDQLYGEAPHAKLRTDGEYAGLPEGQMGNSEVGHLNIGAGRIVYQELTKINKAIENESFFEEQTLKKAFTQARDKNKALHLMGLVSKGGVHSAQKHLYALCDMAVQFGLKKVFIHVFTDGRDCDPHSAKEYIQELEDYIQDKSIKIASVIGRYYAMDRDQRWERIQKAYDLMVKGIGFNENSAVDGINKSYDKGVTDEFIEPISIHDENEEPSTVQEDDVVICFNFRTDRCRQISMALTQKDFPENNMKALSLDYYTMTQYDKNFNNVEVIFKNDNLKNTLGETVSKLGKKQVRIAETEKYPHVTYFFNGGREQAFEGENRILINSPKVATYDLQPEMSAPEVTQSLISSMNDDQPDFVCVNFANPDMVGHTGVYSAIKKAVETVDQCAKQVVETGQKLGYNFIIIADHGNADYAINQDGSPNTAHSLNVVPVIVLSEDTKKINNGILADVAPTICDLMNIEQPQEMSGKSLITKSDES